MNHMTMEVMDAAKQYIESTGRFEFRFDLVPSVVFGLRIQEAYGKDGKYLPISVTRAIANQVLAKVRELAY